MNKRKFLSFDLEQAEPFPEDGKINYRSLGITCAALGRSETLLTLYKAGDNPLKAVRLHYAGIYEGSFAPRMGDFELAELIEMLLEEAALGYRPLTWNGASYDFRMLAEGIPAYRQLIIDELVLPGYDMMYQFLCCTGHFLGLDKACAGQGLAGKVYDSVIDDGEAKMDGIKAIEYWPEYASLVLDYVSWDVINPVLLADVISEQNGEIYWTAGSGNNACADLKVVRGAGSPIVIMNDFRWLTVAECLVLPAPDNSWMSNPVDKREFLGWLL